MAKPFKHAVGERVQVCPKVSSKNAGKYGFIKSRTGSSGYWNPHNTYVITLDDGGKAELIERNVLTVNGAEALVPSTPEKKEEKNFLVIATDRSYVSDFMTYEKANELAINKQMWHLPRLVPNYYVARVVSVTQPPRTVVDQVKV